MCKFPARVLLQMKRQAADIADSTNNAQLQLTAAEFDMAINKLRFLHEQLHSCTCWYEAIRADGGDVSAFDEIQASQAGRL